MPRKNIHLGEYTIRSYPALVKVIDSNGNVILDDPDGFVDAEDFCESLSAYYGIMRSKYTLYNGNYVVSVEPIEGIEAIKKELLEAGLWQGQGQE